MHLIKMIGVIFLAAFLILNGLLFITGGALTMFTSIGLGVIALIAGILILVSVCSRRCRCHDCSCESCKRDYYDTNKKM